MGAPAGAEGWRYRIANLRGLSARALASLRRRGLVPTLELALRRLWPQRQQGISLRFVGDIDSLPPPAFPDQAAPRASIVVPVYGALPVTLRCLHALAGSGDRTPFEVILVDDASPDDSARVL